MAYGGGMGYHLHMPSYFWRTFTEYPFLCAIFLIHSLGTGFLTWVALVWWYLVAAVQTKEGAGVGRGLRIW